MTAGLPSLYLSAEGRDKALEYLRTPEVFGWAYTGWRYLSEENPILRRSVQGVIASCKAESEEIQTIIDTVITLGASTAYFAFREDTQPLAVVEPAALKLLIGDLTTDRLASALFADPNLLDVAQAVSRFDTNVLDLETDFSPFAVGAGCVRLLLEQQLVVETVTLN